jgi:hypothetical protein
MKDNTCVPRLTQVSLLRTELVHATIYYYVYFQVVHSLVAYIVKLLLHNWNSHHLVARVALSS